MCCHGSKVVCKLFCVCKMFKEFCSREHRLRQDITKTHRLQSFFHLFIFLSEVVSKKAFLSFFEVVIGSFGMHTNLLTKFVNNNWKQSNVNSLTEAEVFMNLDDVEYKCPRKKK